MAREDLIGIWVYLEPRNPSAADRIYDLIRDQTSLLKDHPQLGPARPDIADDARVLVIERWLVLYRLIEGGVQIVRIIDGARDLSALEWITE